MSKHTPGPWHACKNGGCPCKTVGCKEGPIAEVTCGNWGDNYPALRFVGDSSLDQKVEAYMEQITYGSVSEEVAAANTRLIAAAPELLAALQEYVRLDEDEHVLRALEGYGGELVMAGIEARAAIAKATGSA